MALGVIIFSVMKVARLFTRGSKETELQPVPDTLLVYHEQFEAAGIQARCPTGGPMCNIVLARADYDPAAWERLVAAVRAR